MASAAADGLQTASGLGRSSCLVISAFTFPLSVFLKCPPQKTPPPSLTAPAPIFPNHKSTPARSLSPFLSPADKLLLSNVFLRSVHSAGLIPATPTFVIRAGTSHIYRRIRFGKIRWN